MISEGYKSFETTISGVCFEAVAKKLYGIGVFQLQFQTKLISD